MRWRKRGHIYRPDGSRWWARKYASFPTVDVRDDVLRVYFTGLDERNYGRTGYVELDPDDPTRILYESPEPVLDLGPIGSFDDCGATAFSIVRVGATQYLYYQGWQRAERIPYLIFTGLATSAGDGDGFVKHARTPILDRTDDDPFLRGAPYVVKQGDSFRMWFVSARRWVEDDHGVHYEVVIRHATSADGILWDADDEPCLVPEAQGDYAVGRPSVLVEGGTYRMWYAIRSFTQPYRIGYAESSDGLRWTRRDADAGIDRSAEGWDSGMICSPQVVRVRDRLLMFYNGNQHGATGFGYAEAT
ncbi:MAG: hypothetical protein M3340_13235 [Actinomycetota bacterium]|nr:hypothetical protein [Actinomycetota bacterium]